MKFSIYQDSRRGGRRSNQDRTGYSYTRDALLMVVADGMGGHLQGDVAAHIAVQFLSEAFQREAQPRLADPFLFLLQGITNAHNAILDYAEARDLLETPRTTCVACVIQDATAYWANVGDSRLYHVRGGQVQARTKDHSRVQALIDQGRLSEEDALLHPDRNKVYSCLGSMMPPQIDLSRKTTLQTGDVVMLCTDGLWGPLSSRTIGAALAREDLLRAVPDLLDLAQDRGGRECDNLSVVAMAWTDATDSSAVPTEALGPATFTTQLEDFGQGGGIVDMSEEEIDQAVAEIRNAIRRHTAK